MLDDAFYEVSHLDLRFVKDDEIVELQVGHAIAENVVGAPDYVLLNFFQVSICLHLAGVEEESLWFIKGFWIGSEVWARLIQVFDACVCWLLKAYTINRMTELWSRSLELMWCKCFVHVAKGNLRQNHINSLRI